MNFNFFIPLEDQNNYLIIFFTYITYLNIYKYLYGCRYPC